MTSQLEQDRAIGEWLAAGAPPSAPHRLLAGALDRVAVVPQDQPGPAAAVRLRLERAPRLRLALLVAALTGLLVAGLLAAGFLNQRPVPALASNGWIVFVARDVRGDSAIHIAREGSPMREIIGSGGIPASEPCLRVSPDGTKLVSVQVEEYTIRDSLLERSAIVIVDLDRAGQPAASERFELTGQQRPSCPAWAPDGQRLAFNAGDARFVLHLGADRIDRVDHCDPCGGTPIWSPDGTEIAAAIGRLIWVHPASGGPARSVRVVPATEAASIATLAWSPDGRWFGVTVSQDDIVPVVTASVRLIDSVSGASTDVAEIAGTSASWSPDWTRVAYVVDGRLWIADVEGGAARQLPVDTAEGPRPPYQSGSGHAPVWSPDGRLVAYLAVADEGSELSNGVIVIVAADGASAPVVITPEIGPLEFAPPRSLAWQPLWP